MVQKQQKDANVRKISKGVSAGASTTYLKKIVVKLKGFIGFLTCSRIKEALITSRKFSLILKTKHRYLAIFASDKSIEIFDPSGFVKTSQPCELLNFIKAQSIKRKLVVNVHECNPSESLRQSIIFLILHSNLSYYNITVNHVLNLKY